MKDPGLLVTLILVAGSAAFPQSCPQLGMNTVVEAENAFFDQKNAQAKNLLARAYSQCRQDAAVLRRIGEVWRIMGDKSQAEHFESLADTLGGKPVLRVITPALDQTEEVDLQLPSVVKRKFALLVGVSKFRDFDPDNAKLALGQPKFRRISDLGYAAKDAADLHNLLTSPDLGRFEPSRASLVVNQDATADRIRREISRIEREANEDDLVLIYISSHGSAPDLDPAAKDAKSAFIMMHNTEIRDGLDTATAYPMLELGTAMSRFRARRVVAFIDTCYSGDTLRGSRTVAAPGEKGIGVSTEDIESGLRITTQDRARIVISSSSSVEKSWESDQISNGYFTYFLKKALQADGGTWNITKVFRYLSENVSSTVQAEKNGAQQHPQYKSFPKTQKEINILITVPETN